MRPTIGNGPRRQRAALPDGSPQSPPDCRWQEERGGAEHRLHVSEAQLGRVAGPMILDDVYSRTLDEAVQRENQHVHIIDLPQKRNEVGNDIDGHDDVGDRAGDERLVHAGHAWIAQQPRQEAQIRRDAPDGFHERARRVATAARACALTALTALTVRGALTYTCAGVDCSTSHVLPPPVLSAEGGAAGG